ncbi:MAG TPA: hypothetical protein VES19_14845 [Candidatus Limnocylindrales bacterium]|nr:hypothetical protein [Candidatus Limnocylindrales bacterium]
MIATTHAIDPASAPILTCGGRIHIERGERVVLELGAGSRRARVALAEDGAVFCGSCALELARGGDDPA